MTRPLTHDVPLDVVLWRRTVLDEAGLPKDVARRIARDARYDLHELLNLIDRGCPPDLAAQIVAPL